MDLTDKQWAVLEPIFRPRRRPDGRGRPWAATRGVLNAVLWILRTGAPWADLPRRYPTYTKPAIAASKSGSDRAASYGIEMIAANRRGRARTQDRRPCAVSADDEKSNASSRGSTTPGASSPDGNAASRTTSAWSSSPVRRSYCGRL